MHEEEIPEESADRRGQEHKEAVQKVIERAEEVRALKGKGYTGSEAAIRQFIAKEKRLRRDLKDEETADPTEIVERSGW